MEPKRQEIDDLLDAALKDYSAVEPRSGLEGRVLARLQAERERPAIRAGWWLAAAAAATASVLTIAVIRPAPQPAPPASVATIPHPPIVRRATPPPVSQGTRNPNSLPDGRRTVSNNHPLDTKARAEAPPKRDQFPSPTPLSEQEQMLALFVQHFHREARLTARAQTRLLEEELRERALPPTSAETPSQDSGAEQP